MSNIYFSGRQEFHITVKWTQQMSYLKKNGYVIRKQMTWKLKCSPTKKENIHKNMTQNNNEK